MQLPHKNPIITSPYGQRGSHFHPGIDMIPAGMGHWPGITEKEKSIQNAKRLRTEIVTCLSGDVVFAGYIAGAGKTVVIDSTYKRKKLRIAYAHLSEMNVKKGDTASEGEIIGKMGNSGCKDIHLHLTTVLNPCSDPIGVFWDGNLVDPLTFLDTVNVPREGTGLKLKSGEN